MSSGGSFQSSWRGCSPGALGSQLHSSWIRSYLGSTVPCASLFFSNELIIFSGMSGKCHLCKWNWINRVSRNSIFLDFRGAACTVSLRLPNFWRRKMCPTKLTTYHSWWVYYSYSLKYHCYASWVFLAPAAAGKSVIVFMSLHLRRPKCKKW